MKNVSYWKEVTIPLETIKTVFKDVFGSENYFKIEIPESYFDRSEWDSHSKYDRTTAWYESNSAFKILLWQIFTVIDASTEKEKWDHMKSLIRQLFYPNLRRLNDDMFNLVDRMLEVHNDKIK